GGGGGGRGRGGGRWGGGGARRPQPAAPCAQRGRCAGQPLHALRCADGVSPNGGNRRTSPRRIPPPLLAARPDQIAVARPHGKERRATRRRQQVWELFGGA